MVLFLSLFSGYKPVRTDRQARRVMEPIVGGIKISTDATKTPNNENIYRLHYERKEYQNIARNESKAAVSYALTKLNRFSIFMAEQNNKAKTYY